MDQLNTLAAAAPAARAASANSAEAQVGRLSVISAEGVKGAERDANDLWRFIQMMKAVSFVEEPLARRGLTCWMLPREDWKRLRMAFGSERVNVDGSMPIAVAEVRNAAPAPDWYAYGVAAMLRAVRYPDARSAVVGRSSDLARYTAQMGAWLPHAQMFAIDHAAAMAGGVNPAYLGQSWFALHYVLFAKPELRASYERFARSVGSGLPVPQAWSEAFPGLSLEAFDVALQSYRRNRPQGAVYEVVPFERDAVNPRPLETADYEQRFAAVLEAAKSAAR